MSNITLPEHHSCICVIGMSISDKIYEFMNSMNLAHAGRLLLTLSKE